MPSLAALSAESTGQIPSDDHPVLSSKLIHFRFENCIFLRSPLATLILNWKRRLVALYLLDHVQISLSLQALKNIPSLEAPDLGLVGHVLAKSVPGVLTVSGDEPDQFCVLILTNIGQLLFNESYVLC